MKLKNKKRLFLNSSLIIIFIFGIIAATITVIFRKDIRFWIEDKPYQTNLKEQKEKETFQTLFLARDLVEKTNIKSLISYDYDKKEYVFVLTQIQKELAQLLEKALDYHAGFKDKKEKYEKNIKFLLSDDKKSLTVNFFLYNRIIKSKKYKNYFRLHIVNEQRKDP